MTRWCEKGIDGFRMDVISLISKLKFPRCKGCRLYGDMNICASNTSYYDYLKEMKMEVRCTLVDIITWEELQSYAMAKSMQTVET